MYQANLCYMPYDRIENNSYKFAFNCVDITTLIKHNFASMAKEFVKLFNFQIYPI